MLVACMLGKGLLELVMTDTISAGKPVWIVYPQRKHLSARVQAFIDWVRELFERTNEPSCVAMPRAAATAPLRKPVELRLA
jgi:LysR family transcriptional regulator for bpeEF and oprC